jgi:L,D-peptidoglycan transpeptidase YkuD (ErfK/YbiS/YcfS/YnhG family)
MLPAVLGAFLFFTGAHAFELPRDSSQCLVGLASGWDSSHATLRLFEKKDGQWVQVAGPWDARLGKKGLIWGRGIHPQPVDVPLKKEGDARTPAGIFRIGGAWGYAPDATRHPRLPYRSITSRDLWVEDPASPHYNRHVRLDAEPSSAWEKKQQMKQGDSAHSLKLFIAHNAEPDIIAGAGSAIFFHIWRARGAKPSAGCTTLSEENLRHLIASIDPAKKPLYIILPADEYKRLRPAWKLP